MPHYVVLVGKRGSGKDTFAEYANKTYGIPTIRFSTVIARLAVEAGVINQTEANDKARLQYAGNTLREKYGAGFYTERLAEEVKGKDCTINGLRHPEELECLSDVLGDGLVLVGITADTEKRYERVKKNVKSFQHFQELEANPAEAKIDGLLQKADVVIENNGSIEDLYQAADKLLKDRGLV